jgi:WD40 repeat-containing protein SMU1
MMHADSAVLALAFSRDSELLASGTNKGEIKVWRVLTGTCVRRFEAAHSDSVTALQFSRDGTQLLSGSLDGTARIHGLKSERRLKEFRSPAGGVTGALFSADFSQVVTSSTGGVVSVWDAKTGTCLHSWRVRPDLPLPLHINSVQWLPRAEDRLVVCERSRNVYVTSASGRSVNTLSCEGKDLACCAPSPRGKFVYAVSEDGVLHAFNVATGVEERPLKLHESEVLAIAHHPHKNVVATLARDGQMLIWHPG